MFVFKNKPKAIAVPTKRAAQNDSKNSGPERANGEATVVNKPMLDTGFENDDDTITSLFVKNLNFSTDEASLRKFMQKCGKVRSVTIAKKKSANGQVELSLGYGFVEFGE